MGSSDLASELAGVSISEGVSIRETLLLANPPGAASGLDFQLAVQIRPERFFYTSKRLDYTFVLWVLFLLR